MQNNVQELLITEKLISLNVYRNMHHYKLNNLKSKWCSIIKIESVKQKIKPVKRCNIKFIFSFADKRKRDPDNYAATAKFIMDGLVHSNILQDDNFDIVESITLSKSNENVEMVKIEIEETL